MPTAKVFVPTDAGGRGIAAPIRSWQVHSSADLGTGEEISLPGYRAAGWLVAPARATVMAALLANGLCDNIEYSTNLADLIDRTIFEVPWWYRSTFEIRGDERTTLRLFGVIHRADLFVNGQQVATRDEIAGAYVTSSFDVTELVTPGLNAVALRVYPGNPIEDLSISWVDWNQWPPDHNMGVWRDVVVERTGDVRLGEPLVTSELSLPGLEAAEVSVEVDVTNLSDEPVTAAVRGRLVGEAGGGFGVDVALGAGERRPVRFEASTSPDLRLDRPRLWWPAGEGDQALYDVLVSVSVDGLVSDQRATRFGVRSVTSSIEPGGGRRFVVNGRPVQVNSAGWVPDLFLRHDPGRIEAELGYAVDVGLNSLRLEGKLENPEFFDAADRLGIMLLPGWECCSKWEGSKGEKGEAARWREQDYEIAARSMASEAVLERNHPSVIGFLIGSDYAPPPRTTAMYLSALERAGWTLPVISAATSEGSEQTGPSGMKMTGPYAWVPPVYWYSKDLERGGAIGFNSEAGCGGTIPRLTSLRRMLSPSELETLWREPAAKQFHAGPPSVFDNLEIFLDALARRYGAPRSLDDFVRKAQLAGYEATRAQFEAFGLESFAADPATGIVYWMFNSAWPSLNWQLHDWYLDPGGAYFGAKKGNEPLHVAYDYGAGVVAVINRRAEGTGPLTVLVRPREIGGRVAVEQRHEVAGLGPREVVRLGAIEETADLGPTFFLELELLAGSDQSSVSRNVYWLSTVPDTLDWGSAMWQYTPAVGFADFKALSDLPGATLEAGCRGVSAGGETTVGVRLRVDESSPAPAVGVHASVVEAGESGEALPVAPIVWSDNDVTLFAGQELELVARCALPPGAGPQVVVEGFNLARMERSVAG